MSFKISSLKAKTSSVAVNIRHPETGEDLIDDQGKEVKVYVFGKASKEYRDHADARLKKALAAQQAKKKVTVPDITVEKVRNDTLDTVVILTDKFENLEDEDGKAIDNKDAIRKLYENPEYFWLVDQVNEAIESDSNFFKA